MNIQTKAAVLYEQNKPLVIETLDIPKLKRGQVLVKILFSGICHSTINEMRGIKGPDGYLPHCLGHEASGIVEEIGPDVTKIQKGDYVVLTWIKGAGLDVPSATYLKGNKQINSGAITTFNEFSIISENRIVKIPREIPADVAALLGCAVPTGAGMVKNSLKIKPKNSLAVFGSGGIGLNAILFASSIGCSKIIAVDICDDKLKLAKDVGADIIINSKKENPVIRIKELTNNQGVDYAIESSGVKEVMEMAFDAIRTGGTALIAGNTKKGDKISIDPYDLINGKKILGTWGGETNSDDDIPIYVDLYLNGKLRLEKLIAHTYELEKINQAFEDIENSKVLGRVLIRL